MSQLFCAYNLNEEILAKSSSGGVFFSLAKHIINNNGVVFGASWTKDWLVEITSATSLEECKKFMTSKYLLADVKNSYAECKKYLEEKKLVLYVGIACQTHGLINFLGKKYDNLILVDIACHGLPSIKMWKDYLKTIQLKNNEITNINFRDKSTGWSNFNFSVSYKNGLKKTESHRVNKYMLAFLSDCYLRDCCYKCKYKNINSCADLIIGDFWTIKNISEIEFNDKGVSFIIANNKFGKDLIENLKNDLFIKELPYSGDLYNYVGMANEIKKKRIKYSSAMFKKRIGIINNSFQGNMGGVIQTYALQQALLHIGYDSVAYTANLLMSNRYLKFIDEHIDAANIGTFDYPPSIPYDQYIKQEDVSGLIVGSDQIWRKTWNNIDNVFLNFASKWRVKKVIFAASMGTEQWDYDQNDNKKIRKLIKQFNGVSVRELDLVKKTKDNIKIKPKLVLDPSFLLTKNDYEMLCAKINKKSGIFTYILDNTNIIKNVVNSIVNKTGKKTFTHNPDILEDWLAGFRDADLVVTDSFHGCVFSLIFNKPFVCIKNRARGNTRFSSLETIFNLNNRFIEDVDELDYSILNETPNCDETIKKLKVKSVKFLKRSLKHRPKIIKDPIKKRIKHFLLHFLPENTVRRKFTNRIYKIFKKVFR